MKKLTIGQPVEVNVTLLSNGITMAPTKVWSAGYVLEGFRDGMAVVKQVKPGLFCNCLTNYALEDVR